MKFRDLRARRCRASDYLRDCLVFRDSPPLWGASCSRRDPFLVDCKCFSEFRLSTVESDQILSLTKRLQESRFRPRPDKLAAWALHPVQGRLVYLPWFFRIVQSQFLTGLSLQASKTLIVTKMNFDYILSQPVFATIASICQIEGYFEPIHQ